MIYRDLIAEHISQELCADCGVWLDYTDDLEVITGICRRCLGEPPVKFDPEEDIVSKDYED
jgi:hypothetical protein